MGGDFNLLFTAWNDEVAELNFIVFSSRDKSSIGFLFGFYLYILTVF